MLVYCPKLTKYEVKMKVNSRSKQHLNSNTTYSSLLGESPLIYATGIPFELPMQTFDALSKHSSYMSFQQGIGTVII